MRVSGNGPPERLSVVRFRAHSHGGSQYCKAAGPLRLCPDPACPYRSQQAQAAGAAEGMRTLPTSTWRGRYPGLQICCSSRLSPVSFATGALRSKRQWAIAPAAGVVGAHDAIEKSHAQSLQGLLTFSARVAYSALILIARLSDSVNIFLKEFQMVKTDRYYTKLIRLADDQVERITDFRFENRIPSEAQAFRKLLDLGLEAAARQSEQEAA